MRPFNLEEAKAGKAVCTKNGLNVKILSFGSKDINPILGIVEIPMKDKTEKIIRHYDEKGRWMCDMESGMDLMMKDL